MKWQYMSKVGLLFTITVIILEALSFAQAPGKPRPLILAEDEGDSMGTHIIKADPQTGSKRLGVGLQHLKGRQGISMHMHKNEDEVLFIHSGSGVGVVGAERRNISAGATLYIPQGTWHGIDLQSEEMEILWVASPPYFAEHLREIETKVSRGEKVSSKELKAIERKHGFRDSGNFFLPRLGTIAAILALFAAFITFFTRGQPFWMTALFALGAALGTGVTLFTIGAGYFPSTTIALVTLLIAAAVFIGAFIGLSIRWLVLRLTSRSN